MKEIKEKDPTMRRKSERREKEKKKKEKEVPSITTFEIKVPPWLNDWMESTARMQEMIISSTSKTVHLRDPLS